eukprot:3525998-Alexandrium_andersonii.AAC.1
MRADVDPFWPACWWTRSAIEETLALARERDTSEAYLGLNHLSPDVQFTHAELNRLRAHIVASYMCTLGEAAP